jgi:hypothetical protein
MDCLGHLFQINKETLIILILFLRIENRIKILRKSINKMSNTIDIISLIESNPITKLGCTYNNRLLEKIKTQFSNTEQQLFLSSFYCYLNYNSDTDFIINFDDVWKWCEFSSKQKAKRLLKNTLIEKKDYTTLLTQMVEQKPNTETRGGHNKEQILISVKGFKKFCMKSNTKKADEIHDYYIKLEELLHETLQEESEELRNKLTLKDVEIHNTKERTLIEQNPKNTLCVYYGFIDNKSGNDENLVKFGRTNNIKERIKEHKKVYSNFKLEQVFKVVNHIEIENLIKNDNVLKDRRRTIEIDGKKYTELLCYDKVDDIEENVKRVITENEYNIINYTILKSENNEMKSKIQILESIVNKTDQVKYENETLNDVYNCKNMDSMKNIIKINKELKNAICMNFFINFIVNHIKLKKGFLDFIVRLDSYEFYEYYKKYRLSNKYTEPLHDEKYEKNILTRSINHITGIKESRGSNGECYKTIHIGEVVKWMNNNIIIPKDYRKIFHIENSKKINYIKYEDKEIEQIYNFFIYFIEKNKKENKKKLSIFHTTITEEYKTFHLSNVYNNKLKMRKIHDTIKNDIPGVQSTNIGKRIMSIDLQKVYTYFKL